MRSSCIVAVVFALLTGGAIDSPSQGLTDQKRAAIMRLIEMTGSMQIGQQMSDAMVSQMSASLGAARPDLGPEVFETMGEVVGEVVEENLPELVALIVPVYDKYFSLAEIEELIAFYETALGRKVVQVLPLAVQESMTEGQRWGASLGPEIQTRVIERLMAEGVDLTAPAQAAGAPQSATGLPEGSEFAYSQLYGGSFDGNLEAVRSAVEAGVDVNRPDPESGLTALTAAAVEGQQEIVEFLILSGADVNGRTTDEIRATALMIAASNGDTRIVEVLIEAGAEVNARDSQGWTALTVATEFEQDAVIEVLRRSGGVQ